MFRTSLLRLIIAALVSGSAGLAAAQGLTVMPAPDWDAVFDRQDGWTGADGIFSIPLDGNEAPGGLLTGNTLFVFSDTFVGKVLPDGSRSLAEIALVNNSMALRPVQQAIPGAVSFLVDRDQLGAPRAVFGPEVPAAETGEWYWMKDGIALRGAVHLFAARFRRDPVEGFYREGVSLISLPRGSRPPFADQIQTDLPLYLPGVEGQSDVSFGAGILPNTETAGAPDPDGYIYVYGTREDPLSKKALVARVPEAAFLKPGAWRFWTGTGWGTDIAQAAVIAGRVSNELSVSPLPDGRYLMVFQLDQIGPQIAVKIGDTPWGPFDPYQVIYDCPEADSFRHIYCYNAKAHPHLSLPGELLISYNVNTLIFQENLEDADIYRPRFIRLMLGAPPPPVSP